MKSIAVINQKGGVAKSTTALALGSLFSLSRSRVLYVDLDAQANLSYSLGAEAGGAGAYELLSQTAKAGEVLTELADGAALIASSPALATADSTITATGKEYRLKEALDSLGGAFDICIIDTPPALGILTINALTAADGVIIPAQADIFSLQGITQLGGTLDTVRRYCNPALKVLGIVLTRYQKRAVISREVAELLEDTAKRLGTRLFASRIRECTAVKEAQASRRSLISYAAGSNAAEDYRALFNEVKEVM